MPGPTRNSLAISDPVLSNFALDYGKNELVTMSGSGMGNTADFLFPQIPHTGPGLTGEYYVYGRANNIDLGDDRRGEGGNYNEIDTTISSDTYTIDDRGFSQKYDDREQEAAFAPVNLSEDAAEVLPERTLLAYANDVITTVTTSGNYAAGVTNTDTATNLGGAWDTSSTDIIGQIASVKRVIHRNCGFMPDSMVTSMDVWTDGIMVNDAILAGLQSMQQAGGLQDFQLPRVIGRVFFDLDLRIDTTLYNAANAQASANPTYLFGKDAVVFASRRQIRRAKAFRFGATFVRPNEFLRGYRWFEAPHTNWRAVSFQRATKLVSDEGAYLIQSCTS